MDFRLTEDDEMIRTTVRDFARKEIEPIADELDQNEEYPFEILKKLAALGITGLTIPEEYGGSGGTFFQWCLALEEISYACAGTATILDTSWGLAAHCINEWGNEEQKKRFLTPLAKGEKLGAFGLTEADAGSDPAAAATTAVKDGDSYILNGTKVFISNANEADIHVIFATRNKSLGHRGMCAFIVEKGTPGLSIGKQYHKLGIRAAHNAEIVLQDCRVPAENMLGPEARGFSVALSTLDGGRAAIGALSIGIAQAALDAAVKHTKERVQYGRAIAHFQGIQFLIADLATEIEAARLLVYRAASLKDRGQPFTVETAMAKKFAGEVAMKVTQKGIQMWGGYGYMMDSPMQRYFRDAKIMEIYEGTSEMMRLIIARRVIG
ncbi:MAG: acyl-CoA dehydrogenase family protein [Dehalococcoidia bacterium]|nr:acyl-CoA dehydrogenase family protein [Dehalococcoidia bacterium]